MLLYCLPATLVLAIAVHTLMQDKLASKTDGETWLFFILAAVLWPITLPSILWKKCSDVAGSTELFEAPPEELNAFLS